MMFSALPISVQYAVMAVMFICGICQLELIMYKLFSRRGIAGCIADVGIFAVLFTALAYITASVEKGKVVYTVGIPYAVIAAFSGYVLIRFVIQTAKQKKRNRNTLSPSSVKQSLDNLDSGICFADSDGRIILINRTMGKLTESIIGRYPQMLGEIENMTKNADGVSGLGNGLFMLGDKKVWSFKTEKLSKAGLEGYTQTVAYDVTELYNSNEMLKNNNEKLRKTNEKTQQMYEELADRIREQETLNLKIKIHNDIGRSLISIAQIDSEAQGENMDTQLALLQNAVSYFSDHRGAALNSTQDVIRRAAGMNVKLITLGALPDNTALKSLFLTACDECVTNCVNHAYGTEVQAAVSLSDGVWKMRFTNNGTAPTQEISEGGGLSSLRRKAVDLGGEMYYEYSPEFALIIKIKNS